MKRLILLLIVAVGALGAYYSMRRPPGPLVLTGIVTTEDVMVGPQEGGQFGRLWVREADKAGGNHRMAVRARAEWKADGAYYARTVDSSQSKVGKTKAASRH